MFRRRFLRQSQAALATVLALMAVAPLPAQTRSMMIEGFEAFRWGTPMADIIAARGDPAQSESVGDGLSLIAYRETVSGIPLVAVYGVHETAGLIKGQYTADVNRGDDCLEMFVTLRESVNAQYPLLRPVERRFHREVDDFCEAVSIGEAGWMVQWNDPATESFISVYIRAGTSTVEVAFESKAFQDWAEQRDDPPATPNDSPD